MIQDIYTREPDDPNFRSNVLSHSNPIESIITKVKMILGTTKGQILGNLGFGIGIEDLIFETKINSIQLEESILTQIQLYVSEAANYSIRPNVEFGKSDGNDYCVIDIYINNQKTFGVLVK